MDRVSVDDFRGIELSPSLLVALLDDDDDELSSSSAVHSVGDAILVAARNFRGSSSSRGAGISAFIACERKSIVICPPREWCYSTFFSLAWAAAVNRIKRPLDKNNG